MNSVESARIIYLEDSELDAEIVRVRLAKSSVSHSLLVVTNRDDYVAALAREEFDLILCDYQLPTITGPDALKIAQELRPETPFIFVSGVVGEENAIETLKSGATDYVLKQRLNRLIPAVERALLEAHIRREQARTAEALQAAQDRLRESEVRFRHMADHSPVMVWVTDEEGSCTYLNRNWYDFTGQSTEEALKFGWLQATHPDDKRLAAESYMAAHARREGFRMEYRLRRSDGTYRWMIDAGAPRFSESGEFLGYVGSVIDIHDRRQAEDDLRDARSRLDSALEAGAIATWVWDIPNNRVFADANLARLFGVSDEEAQGGELGVFLKAIHPDDIDRVSEVINLSVRTGGRFESDYRLKTATGHTVWVIARGRVEKDYRGVPVRLSGVVQDVTERRLAEAERTRLGVQIEHERRRLRTVLDTAPVGVIVAEAPSGKITFVNPMAEEILGYAPKATRLEEYRELVAYHGDGRRLEYSEYSLARALKGEIVRNAEYQFQRSDGRRCWIRVSGSPIRDGNPDPVGAVIVFGNVDREKRALEELEETDRRKNEFLAMLAHELRNPLAPVSNSLQILRKGNNPDYLATACEMMERQVRHLGRLIDDLLDVSRIGRGKITLRTEFLDLRAVIAEAVESVRPQAEAVGHVLTASYPKTPIIVAADPTRLEQVFVNLLNNAIKYTEPGGRIIVNARVENDRAIMEVCDTGVGISREQLNQVFELFMQVSRSIDRSQGGLGIGLTLVKRLVEMHGGKVTVHSDGLGSGSTFTVSLPLSREAIDTQTTKSNASPAAPLRICVVDDNVDGAASMAILLQALGHSTMIAHDGPSAEEMIRRERPDLVIMDIGLPGMNGYEVAKRLREDFPREKLRLVALTGYGQDDDRRRSLEAGFDTHLVKPVELDVLNKVLQEREDEG
ncbi:PAS domain S-box protein [Zavarzinella formosa]|uniref:PAS domain S-box protein n=1 Tax=Zavarzinella formosa TaxID=360055 RepID=UPI00036A32AC|nr:PAS domain S-box protein [Zavarzinella formosa]